MPQSVASLSNALDLMRSSLFRVPARLTQGTNPLSKFIRVFLDELAGHVLLKISRRDGWLESITDIPFGSITAHCYVHTERVSNVRGEQLNCDIAE